MNAELIILGYNSLCGPYLADHIAAAGQTATILSRRPIQAPQGFRALTIDLNVDKEWHAPKGAIILSLLPIWVLAAFLSKLSKAQAIIAVSSTSKFSKSESADSKERDVAAWLEQGEAALHAFCGVYGIVYTILRPTLIYDGVTDQNITRMARFIRRWGFLPVAYPSNGLRQPIHASDVAMAIFKCANNPACANQSFNISGSEVLSYLAMATRVFTAAGKKPRFIKLPVPLLRIGFGIVCKTGLFKRSGFGASIFQRMNEDLVFETQSGLRAIGYAPRGFQPEFKAQA